MTDYKKTLEQELLLDGRMFGDAVDANSTSLDLLISNPSDSGVELITFTASVSHDDTVTIVIYDEVSSVSGGTPQDADNNFVGHPRMEEADVVKNPTFNGENEHSRVSYLGSGTEDVLTETQLALKEDHDLLISIMDQSGSAKLMSAFVSWGEIKKGTYR